jgi:hypothetical protein
MALRTVSLSPENTCSSLAHLRGIEEADAVHPGRVPGNHHAAGDDDSENRPEKRIQTGPFHIRETQTLVGDATLLKEQLLGRERGAHDGDDQKR